MNVLPVIRVSSVASTKGSGHDKRFNSMRKKRQKKYRKCHGSEKSGHDKRNCLARKKGRDCWFYYFVLYS